MRSKHETAFPHRGGGDAQAVSAKEVAALIDHLTEEYSIDLEKIYATGFSMGGIKIEE